ncbi:MAG: DDE-type integrase/transposase/recombinase [Oscillospiraceae bacterium]
MILRCYPRYKDDIILLWDSLRKSGYKRSYYSLVRVINKWLKPEQKKKSPRKLMPYERVTYPGQKVQIDVKFVPSYCAPNGHKYYQYTAIDECTRLVYKGLYDEHSTYSSADFFKKLVVTFPFAIREIQTDNGSEFTNALLVKTSAHQSLFEQALDDMNILYHRIRVATPRHNGKVERQHRTDEKRFYKKMKMYNLEDGRKQLQKYNQKSNNIPKICLNFRTPNEVLTDYLSVM